MKNCDHGPVNATAEFESTEIYEGWTVQKGYYGSHEADDRRNHPLFSNSGYGCETPTWAVEMTDKAKAKVIVEYAAEIDAKLTALGINHTRLAVGVRDDALFVCEYDWASFQFQIERTR